MKTETTAPALPAHSPGHWTVGHANPENNKLPIVSDRDGVIAWVNPRPCFDDNQAANAYLIAAAPETAAERDRLREELRELREALGASLAWIERHRPKGKIGDIFTELNEMENGILKPARAVLAKTNPKA